jgi:MscS family membrane protein
LAVVGVALGMLTGALVRSVLGRAAKRTVTIWDDRILARSRGPVALAFTVGFMRALLPQLLLYEPAELFVHQVLRALLMANVLWAFWRLVDVVAELSWSSAFSFEHPSSRALIPLARRMGKAVVAVAAILLLISALGYPVTSLIAGLGIGGLALALASQKTVENLFGAFSLGIDQPFREGDFVRIENLTGTVESLGLRSTRIRTPDRTVVSIPNGKLAEMRLETFAARDRLRLACVIGLEYATTSEQMRQVLAELERVLREHPQLHPDGLSVRFIELAASSLNVEVVCFFATRDVDEFSLIRQELLLTFLHIIEKAGTRIAFPTRTLHVQAGASGVAA